MKILCILGKYQYGDSSRGLSTEFFSFIPAFENLEHEVVLFDSLDKNRYKNFIDMNQSLVDVVEREKPEIIFSVLLGYEIWTETLDYIRGKIGCKIVNWCTDDSWKFKEHSKFIGKHVDLMVTTYEEFLPKYKDLKINSLLSGWAVPFQWSQIPMHAEKCKYDVTFVGTAHGSRKQYVSEIKNSGINVECFGHGWENGSVEAEEIPKIFNTSKISLNFSNSNGENQIKARTFEVPGCGGFLLSGNAKNLENIYENKKEIVIFNNIEECINEIKYYLANEKSRDEIAYRGYEKTIREYTYTQRLSRIIEHLTLLESEKVDDIDLGKTKANHSQPFYLRLIKNILIIIGILIFGKYRGRRFARRLVYEFSWRFFGKSTYSSSGIVGRMFYHE